MHPNYFLLYFQWINMARKHRLCFYFPLLRNAELELVPQFWRRVHSPFILVCHPLTLPEHHWFPVPKILGLMWTLTVTGSGRVGALESSLIPWQTQVKNGNILEALFTAPLWFPSECWENNHVLCNKWHSVTNNWNLGEHWQQTLEVWFWNGKISHVISFAPILVSLCGKHNIWINWCRSSSHCHPQQLQLQRLLLNTVWLHYTSALLCTWSCLRCTWQFLINMVTLFIDELATKCSLLGKKKKWKWQLLIYLDIYMQFLAEQNYYKQVFKNSYC